MAIDFPSLPFTGVKYKSWVLMVLPSAVVKVYPKRLLLPENKISAVLS
jgi:hypothetical protein